MADYIERDALLAKIRPPQDDDTRCAVLMSDARQIIVEFVKSAPAADVVPVVSGHSIGDFCIYAFDNKNKSLAIVEIVRILNDERGAAEIKFHKVLVDDTGNGFFNYLLKTGQTMNASLKYLKNITPRVDLEYCEEEKNA